MAGLLASLAVLAASPRAAAGEDGCFVFGPVVTQVDAERASVIWVSEPGLSEGQLVLEKESDAEVRRLSSDASVPRFQQRGEDDLAHVRHLVQLDDLDPATAYAYEARCDDGRAARRGTFSTLAAPGEEAPASFVVMSDTHTSHDAIAEAVAGDSPEFVMITGDLTSGRGHDWNHWPRFFESGRPYLESTAFWPVVGGHDVGPARNFRALFGFDEPGNDPADEDDAATYYSFKFANVHVLALDHVYDHQAQLEWAQRELADSDADWIIVTLHHSIFTVGSRGGLMGGVYDDFASMFERYGVDLVVFGHDHVYERSLPLGADGVKPVHYITVHAAGNFREPRPSPVIAGGIAQKSYMYAHFEVAGNELVMEAKEADGTVIDRLELVKDERGLYQDAIMDAAIERELALELAHVYTGQDLDEDLRYERRDLEAELASFPRADQTVNATLDVRRFPTGSELIIHEQRDPAGWRVAGQSIEITDPTIAFELTAPRTLRHGEGTLDPAIELRANVRLDGREFEPVTLRPNLGPDTRAMLAPERIPEHLGLSVRDYSDDLVPATRLDLPTSPSFTDAFHSRGEHLYYTWFAEPGDTIELRITGGGISQQRYRDHGDFALELYRPARDASGPVARVDPEAGRQMYLIEGERVATATVRRTGEPTAVSLASDHEGMHLLRYDDNRDRTTLQWDPHVPLTLKAAVDDNPSSHEGRRQRQLSAWNLLFYVPKGTPTIDGHARASQGRIEDPDGNPALDLEDREGYFSIPVDEAHQGTLWQLRDYRGSEIYFLNVPPYLARSAGELLLPREVVERDAADD